MFCVEGGSVAREDRGGGGFLVRERAVAQGSLKEDHKSSSHDSQQDTLKNILRFQACLSPQRVIVRGLDHEEAENMQPHNLSAG